MEDRDYILVCINGPSSNESFKLDRVSLEVGTNELYSGAPGNVLLGVIDVLGDNFEFLGLEVSSFLLDFLYGLLVFFLIHGVYFLNSRAIMKSHEDLRMLTGVWPSLSLLRFCTTACLPTVSTAITSGFPTIF